MRGPSRRPGRQAGWARAPRCSPATEATSRAQSSETSPVPVASQMQPSVSGDPDGKSRRDQGSACPVPPLASPADSSRSTALHGMSRIAHGAGPWAPVFCVPACAASPRYRHSPEHRSLGPAPWSRRPCLPRASQDAATLRWDSGQCHLSGEGLSRTLRPVGNPASCSIETA